MVKLPFASMMRRPRSFRSSGARRPARSSLANSERAASLAKAAYAWREVGEHERARVALDLALAQPSLEPDWRARLQTERRALAQVAKLGETVFDLTEDKGRRRAGVRRPLRSRFGSEGGAIVCSGESSDSLTMPLTHNATDAFEVDVDVTFAGDAWCATAQVGLFELSVVIGRNRRFDVGDRKIDDDRVGILPRSYLHTVALAACGNKHCRHRQRDHPGRSTGDSVSKLSR